MARKWWTLLTVCLGMLMLLLDITVVNVALPRVAHDLDASFSDLQWVIDAYALSLAALLLVAGSLGDLIGHRTIFAAGLVVFCVSSLLCGLASSPLFLVLSRAAQGIGGAAMFATSLALIGKEFRGRDRGTALGIWGGTAGAAVAVGPLIGGALTSGLSWRWVFFVNVPVGALTVALLLAKVTETGRRAVRPDWPGAACFSGALFALVFGVIRGNPDGWSSTKVITALALGGVLLTVFVAIELTRRNPMLDLRLFRTPAIVGATLGSIAIAGSLFAAFLYISLYLQNILGYSPIQAGLRYLPITLMVLLVAPLTGRLSSFVPVGAMFGGGLALIAVGLALMTRVGPGSGWTALLAGFIVAGVGSGLVNPARGSVALGTVPPEQAGVGSGVNNTALQVGIAGGIAALGAIFQSRVHGALADHLAAAGPRIGGRAHAIAEHATSGNPAQALQALPQSLREPVAHALRAAFVEGFDRILWIGAAISLAGALVTLVLVRGRDLESTTQEPGHRLARAGTSATDLR